MYSYIKFVAGKPGGKITLWRRYEMYFKEIRCEASDRVQLAQDRDHWWAVVRTSLAS
jgi:hypothetical protein